jgi:hypothetical protein
MYAHLDDSVVLLYKEASLALICMKRIISTELGIRCWIVKCFNVA